MKKKIIISLAAVLTVAIGLGVFLGISPEFGGGNLSFATSVLAEDYSMIKSGKVGEDICFSKSDFEKTLGVESACDITITALPDESEGILKVGDVRLNVGDTVSADSLDMLIFTPASISKESSFSFTACGYMGGAEMKCKLLQRDGDNTAPSAGSATATVSTQKNISIWGRMDSIDPENDKTEYFVVSFPEKGRLEILSGYGDFKYTPDADYTGNDSFSYIVRDCWGSFSEIATVNIKVEKNKIDLEYLDMLDCSAHNASLVLASEKIMLGKLCGDGMYFMPNESVSREEFVSMAMKAAGIEKIAGLENTCFDDDSEISDSLRPYIATAQKLGFINGSFDGNGLVFRPKSAITRAEAAVIVSNMLNLTVSTSSTPTFSDIEEIPSWAKGSIIAVYQNKIFSVTALDQMTIDANEELTRAQTAETLYAMMNSKS